MKESSRMVPNDPKSQLKFKRMYLESLLKKRICPAYVKLPKVENKKKRRLKPSTDLLR